MFIILVSSFISWIQGFHNSMSVFQLNCLNLKAFQCLFAQAPSATKVVDLTFFIIIKK